MSKNTEIQANLLSEKDALAKEELKLFSAYNRHAKADVKPRKHQPELGRF